MSSPKSSETNADLQVGYGWGRIPIGCPLPAAKAGHHARAPGLPVWGLRWGGGGWGAWEAWEAWGAGVGRGGRVGFVLIDLV